MGRPLVLGLLSICSETLCPDDNRRIALDKQSRTRRFAAHLQSSQNQKGVTHQDHALFFHGGAEGRTRTGTGRPATPSRWCVYHVPPLRHIKTCQTRPAIQATHCLLLWLLNWCGWIGRSLRRAGGLARRLSRSGSSLTRGCLGRRSWLLTGCGRLGCARHSLNRFGIRDHRTLLLFHFDLFHHRFALGLRRKIGQPQAGDHKYDGGRGREFPQKSGTTAASEQGLGTSPEGRAHFGAATGLQ
jgi:hypothetical protein